MLIVNLTQSPFIILSGAGAFCMDILRVKLLAYIMDIVSLFKPIKIVKFSNEKMIGN